MSNLVDKVVGRFTGNEVEPLHGAVRPGNFIHPLQAGKTNRLNPFSEDNFNYVNRTSRVLGLSQKYPLPVLGTGATNHLYYSPSRCKEAGFDYIVQVSTYLSVFTDSKGTSLPGIIKAWEKIIKSVKDMGLKDTLDDLYVGNSVLPLQSIYSPLTAKINLLRKRDTGNWYVILQPSFHRKTVHAETPIPLCVIPYSFFAGRTHSLLGLVDESQLNTLVDNMEADYLVRNVLEEERKTAIQAQETESERVDYLTRYIIRSLVLEASPAAGSREDVYRNLYSGYEDGDIEIAPGITIQDATLEVLEGTFMAMASEEDKQAYQNLTNQEK